MIQFRQFCRLLLWIHLLIFVLCETGTAYECSLRSFQQSRLYDENFEVSRLRQSYEGGATVRVPCKMGFRGFFKMTCSDEGWKSQSEKCTPIPCGHPGDVQFADFALVQGTDYVFGSQVKYTCHRGYQMTSYTSTRNCLQQGWDGHLPVCEPISCPSLTVPWNVLVNGDLDQAQSGSVVQFRCSSNDEELTGPSQIVCGDNGEWDNNEEPACRPIICPKPQLDNFVLEEEKTEYKKDDVLRYRCNQKYRKVDGRPSMCKKVGQSGQWTPPPRCELKTCKLSTDRPAGTTYSPGNKVIFRPDENVTVSCTKRLWVKNKELQSAELTCLDTGEWNFDPVCKLVTCNKVDDKVHRWGSNSYYHRNTADIDESVWYRCNHGYEEKSPTRTATCKREGWEPNPLCREGRCAKPSYNNAEITDYYYYQKDIYNHNERVNFRCTHDPYVTFHVDCHFGKWTHSTNQPCKEKPCTTQPNIENGEIHSNRKAEYEHGETLHFLCTGETTFYEVTCQSGEWSQQKSCQDVPCLKPNITNGELIGQRMGPFNHGETVDGRCTTGSEENFSISCQSGEWIPKILCPEKSACGSPDIDNGFWVEHETKAYYRCNDGYKLLIKGWWSVASCVDGKWNTSECIAKTDCGPVPHIPHMIVSSDRKSFRRGEHFTILCEKGHQKPSGLEALTCTKGKWTSDNVELNQICTPIANKCKTPHEIKNAVIMAAVEKEYLSETTLTYKCRDKEGESTIQCHNGTWQPDPNNISCESRSSEAGD